MSAVIRLAAGGSGELGRSEAFWQRVGDTHG